MKGIINNKLYLEEFDIYVEPYLTYEQIQQIVRSIIKQDDWSVRQQTIDMLILYHATNVKKEDLEKVGHDELLKSGLIDAVKKSIKNIYQIKEAIDYTQSTTRALQQIVEKLPQLKEIIQEVTYKNGRSNKK